MLNLFSKEKMKNINPEEAKNNMETDKSIILLDVRSELEHNNIRIKNSINIPVNDISKIETTILKKDSTIYVYCLSGARSSMACSKLNKMGYTNIFNLGGINSWPFEKISGK